MYLIIIIIITIILIIIIIIIIIVIIGIKKASPSLLSKKVGNLRICVEKVDQTILIFLFPLLQFSQFFHFHNFIGRKFNDVSFEGLEYKSYFLKHSSFPFFLL